MKEKEKEKEIRKLELFGETLFNINLIILFTVSCLSLIQLILFIDTLNYPRIKYIDYINYIIILLMFLQIVAVSLFHEKYLILNNRLKRKLNLIDKKIIQIIISFMILEIVNIVLLQAEQDIIFYFIKDIIYVYIAFISSQIFVLNNKINSSVNFKKKMNIIMGVGKYDIGVDRKLFFLRKEYISLYNKVAEKEYGKYYFLFKKDKRILKEKKLKNKEKELYKRYKIILNKK